MAAARAVVAEQLVQVRGHLRERRCFHDALCNGVILQRLVGHAHVVGDQTQAGEALGDGGKSRFCPNERNMTGMPAFSATDQNQYAVRSVSDFVSAGGRLRRTPSTAGCCRSAATQEASPGSIDAGRGRETTGVAPRRFLAIIVTKLLEHRRHDDDAVDTGRRAAVPSAQRNDRSAHCRSCPCRGDLMIAKRMHATPVAQTFSPPCPFRQCRNDTPALTAASRTPR